MSTTKLKAAPTEAAIKNTKRKNSTCILHLLVGLAAPVPGDVFRQLFSNEFTFLISEVVSNLMQESRAKSNFLF